MKKSHLFYILIATLLCFSCGGKETNNSEFDFESQDYAQNDNQQINYNQQGNYTQNSNEQQSVNYQINNRQQQKSNNNELKPYKIMSPQFGMSFGIMPIPQSWNKKGQNQENVMFESADGVKVYGEQFFSFSYHNDLQRNQIMQQNGSNIQPLKSLERVISEDFIPYLQNEGVTFVRQYPLPQLAQLDKRFDSYMFKATPENKQFQCMVTEWKDQKGNLSVGIVRYFITQYTSIGGIDWGYTINSMEAPKGAFENAKQALINALVNLQINPQWVKANNQHYSQMAAQNNAGHQQRMAAIKAQGQAILNNGRINSSILDSNHESWKRRNAMTDAGQANTVNGIWERSNMTDQSGNTYQVEGYNNNVWMNNNNEYIGTDNPNWNPNIDNTTNDQNWEQLEYTDGY